MIDRPAEASICLGAAAQCYTSTHPLIARSSVDLFVAARGNGANLSFPFGQNCCRSCNSSYTCSNSRMEEQHFTDFLLPRMKLPRHKPPIFIELGGFNGIHESNTIFLQHCLGWRGVLFEAQPAAFHDLLRNRPGVVAVQAAISDECVAEGSTVSFEESPGTSGKIRPHNYTKRKLVTVPCAPLSRYVSLLGAEHISFLSLDVEGGELNVLRSLDWAAQSVGVLVVEELHEESSFAKNAAVEAFLSRHTRMVKLFVGCWHPRGCDAYWVDPKSFDMGSVLARNRTYDVMEPAKKGRQYAVHRNSINKQCVAPPLIEARRAADAAV